MTITMIIAIIAAMMFGGLCVLILFQMDKNKKEAERQNKAMVALEKKLGLMTELINSRTEALEMKIDEKPMFDVFSDMIDVNPYYPYDTPASESMYDGIDISDILKEEYNELTPDEPEDFVQGSSINDDENLKVFMDSFKAFEAEVLGFADSVEDMAESGNEAEIIITPRNGYSGEDTGRSGRKYTKSELELLIRE